MKKRIERKKAREGNTEKNKKNLEIEKYSERGENREEERKREK